MPKGSGKPTPNAGETPSLGHLLADHLGLDAAARDGSVAPEPKVGGNAGRWRGDHQATRVMRAVMNVALSVLILATPLGLWRVLYPLSDWAALALVPLGVVLFVGFRTPLAGCCGHSPWR